MKALIQLALTLGSFIILSGCKTAAGVETQGSSVQDYGGAFQTSDAEGQNNILDAIDGALHDMKAANVANVSVRGDGALEFHSPEGFKVRCGLDALIGARLCRFWDATADATGGQLNGFHHVAPINQGFNRYLAYRIGSDPAAVQIQLSDIQGEVVTTYLVNELLGKTVVCTRNNTAGRRSCKFGDASELESIIDETAWSAYTGTVL